jgi:hypothetical protein
MKSLVFPIAWSLWWRHRMGFTVAAVILAVIATVFPFLASVVPAGTMAVACSVPLVGIFAFVLNALLFVEDAGSLSSRYPRYMLTLPVRTTALAFSPMLLASGGAGLLWVVTAMLIYGSCGYSIPVLIPALGLAGMMAWAQALAWMPVRNFWIREFLTIILVAALGALGALPIWLAFTGGGSTGLADTLLILYIAAAHLVAWAAVAGDRQGADWRLWPARSTVTRIAGPLPQTRSNRPFRSPLQAQLSYEWNCHGLMLNGFVSVILFMIWGVLLLRQGHGTPEWLALIFFILPIVIVTTIAATGISLGRLRPFWSHIRGFVREDTFVATRPMTTARLVASKFRMAAESVCLNWALAVAGTTGWLVSSDNLDNATILVHDFFRHYHGGKGIAIIALTSILLPALSWRLLTAALVPVLTGRRWIAEGAVWLYLSLVVSLGGCGLWLTRSEPSHVARLYSSIPVLVAVVAILKGAAAVTAFRATLQRGLLSWRNIAGILGLWLFLTGCGVALALLVGLTSFAPVSWLTLALGVGSLVPLVRFPLATLALDMNRHR